VKRIILSGCNGKMGRTISETVSGRKDCIIVAGFDINIELKQEYPVLSDPKDYDGNADVIIDFSHPAFITKLLDFAVKRGIPAVIATTGLSVEQVEQVKAAALHIPVFYSGNMSIGVNLIIELAKKAAAVLSDSFDIEIIEMHHNQKLDAPSGTALMLANAVSSVLDEKPEYKYDRHIERKKREKNEIGIHSVRGGTIVGEHEIVFAGKDEIIKISHSAMSKQIFATGAINAALYLTSRKTGFYNMSDLVSFYG
jgi:4-hydroxy-tetrahydrodipicolinate reductase